MRFSVLLAAGSLVASPAAFTQGLTEAFGGHAAAYEGTVEIKQSIGDTTANVGKFVARLTCRVSEPTPGKLEVLLVRFLNSLEEGQQPMVGFDVASLSRGPEGFKLEPGGGTTAELEEGSLALKALFPLMLLPEFAAPPSGSEPRTDVELTLLGSVVVKVPLVASRQEAGESLTLLRRLAEGATPTFQFRDETSKLLRWSESYKLDSGKGLPSRLESALVFEGSLADSTVRFEQTLILNKKKSSDGLGDEGAKLASIEKDLRSLGVEFAAFKSPEEIAKQIGSFQAKARGTLFESVNDALDQRLAVYKASGLGKLAADFTLESLDGKKVSFREATRGKVVLLSFWGVG